MVERDWPQEIRPKRMLANFRPSVSEQITAPAKKSWRASRTGMSPEHLRLIRQLPCCVCPDHRQIEAHHLKSGGAKAVRGISLKATDRHAVPLCFEHHRAIERIGSRREIEWFMSFAIDCHALAQGLWNRSGDVRQMSLVLTAHKLAAIRQLMAERKAKE